MDAPGWISVPTITIVVFVFCNLARKPRHSPTKQRMTALAVLMSSFFNVLMIPVCWVGICWPQLQGYNLENFVAYLVIAVSLLLIGAKVLSLITQDSRFTASECQFKSALQIWLLAFIYQSSSEPVGPLWLSSVISSILLYLGNQVCLKLSQNTLPNPPA